MLKELGLWIKLIYLKANPVAGFCAYGNKHLGSIKEG
jgi:hypothetical protein